MSPYFIEISLNKSDNSAKRYLLNQIPTDFMIDKENVDLLIEEGNKQLVADRIQNCMFERNK
ncbi:hypothetical protein O9992_18645 [Vibrio lentus]|nr:hypothetical protein [Vibrio lentus]